ncbi:hypothetical protein N0V93_003272 [Gnomoniopsis smithogilvyi]|uniref:Uncharacterized protein n=1 Tax=Gnomoniopsis smithogilvyi TaxID=1191159 RepID=A0A9W8Z0E8_9PEZI|nr:hypothetical protein N0V93_003272 [Gnomoniopsis smithogilvyi]
MSRFLTKLTTPAFTRTISRPSKFSWTISGARMATGKSENHELQANALFDVSHITAVVTGGATGIGLIEVITQALQSNGAKVYITGRREDVLQKAAELYSTGPGSIHPLAGDISSKEETIRLAKELEKKESGGINLLVNNAGIARDDDTKFSTNGQPDMKDAKAISEHFLKTKEEQWAETLRTNVAAQYYMSMAFLPLLAKGGSENAGLLVADCKCLLNLWRNERHFRRTTHLLRIQGGIHALESELGDNFQGCSGSCERYSTRAVPK